VERVAQQATKAAPAVAIAGALVAAPQVSHALAANARPVPVTAQAHAAHAAASTKDAATSTATLDSIATRTVTVAVTHAARPAATATSTIYKVRSGDTLSRIAQTHFHNTDWQYLYHENAKAISDPNLIYVGQSLVVPATAPAHYQLAGYVPRHAKPTAAAPATTTTASYDADDSASQSTPSHAAGGSTGGAASGTVVVQSAPQSRGQYSCSGLEQLWDQAGGNPGDAFLAAEVAMAESGGNPNALSPTDDYGLWQINASNGALATFNPYENAKSAVVLSDNGSNWSAWTTYTSGEYYGKC
jgi:LysM repeat protein